MSLSEQTKQLTENFISSQSAENQAIIQDAFGVINAADFGANALREGDQAKSFQLPNAKGGKAALADLLAQGPVVISFYRGGWCPYCWYRS